MLEGLHAFLQQPDLIEDTFVRLESIEFKGDDGLLAISVLDYGGQETWSRWTVTARGIRDYCIRDAGGDLSLFESGHVLALQHTDRCQGLSFRGMPRSAPECVGRLMAAHIRAVGDWIPFRRYLNTLCDLEQLLAGGFGQLADGPSFLMKAYADVLRQEGIAARLLADRPAKCWMGRQWVENPFVLATLLIGDAYVVGVDFEERRA